MIFGVDVINWKGIDGMKDKKFTEYSIDENIFNNLSIKCLRRDYKSQATKDTSNLVLNYVWDGDNKSTRPHIFPLSKSAYKFNKFGSENMVL